MHNLYIAVAALAAIAGVGTFVLLMVNYVKDRPRLARVEARRQREATRNTP